MRFFKYFIFLVSSLLCFCQAVAQESRAEFCVEFRVGSAVLDPQYNDNAASLSMIRSFLDEVRRDSTRVLTEVAFRGGASPEGSDCVNRRLAHGRMMALRQAVCRDMALPDSLLRYDDGYIPWDYLRALVSASSIACRDEVLAILESEPGLVRFAGNCRVDGRVPRLQALRGGRVWQQLHARFFAQMRSACVVMVTCRHVEPLQPVRPVSPDTILPPQPTGALLSQPEPALPPEVVPVRDTLPAATKAQPALPAMPRCPRRVLVKTNALEWGLAIANVALEADVACHWSVMLPVSYSAWDYFTSRVKFRTLSYYPEARYWISPWNDGWFLGAHLGIAWYNFAINGTYRTQDKSAHDPAWGGGLSVGYRLPLRGGRHWRLELSAGAGAYRLRYDKFLNEPNGRLVRTEYRNYFGPDRLSVTVAYTFDWKGGKR